MQVFLKPDIKTKNHLICSLQNTYCRLRPSKIEGVGVFAIRTISKGINPFKGTDKQKWYALNISHLKHLNNEVLKMIDDFYVIDKHGNVLISEQALNGMDISFFINHSQRPNIKTIDGGFTFVTLRKIIKGEEITVAYGTYDDKYRREE